VGIGRTDPQYQLDVQHNATNVARFESTSSSANVIIKTPSGSDGRGRVVFDNTTASDTLILEATNSDSLEIKREGSTTNSLFRFRDGAALPAVTIDKQGSTVSGREPRVRESTLNLVNSDPTTFVTDSRTRVSSISFSSYLTEEEPLAQRGFISSGPAEFGKGYGFMAFGVQQFEEPNPDDVGATATTIFIKDGHKVGINNTSPVNTLDIRGNHTGTQVPTICLRGDVDIDGGIIGRLRYLSDDTSAEGSIIGRRVGNDIRHEFETGPGSSILKVHPTGSLTLGLDNDNSEGHVNMENNSLLSLEASFSAASAANSEQILHLFHAGARAAKVLVHVDEVGTTFTSELTILIKNTDVYATEYGVVISDGTTKNVKFEVDYAGGFARLKAVNISGNTKYLRVLITMLGYG
jgi:hypothetical protein